MYSWQNFPSWSRLCLLVLKYGHHYQLRSLLLEKFHYCILKTKSLALCLMNERSVWFCIEFGSKNSYVWENSNLSRQNVVFGEKCIKTPLKIKVYMTRLLIHRDKILVSSENSDQPAHPPRLTRVVTVVWRRVGALAIHKAHTEEWSDWVISVFAEWIDHFVGLNVLRLKYLKAYECTMNNNNKPSKRFCNALLHSAKVPSGHIQQSQLLLNYIC